MLALVVDTVKNNVWQIRVSADWLARLKIAAEAKSLPAAAYLRMIATERMDIDGVPKVAAKKPKK